MIRVWVLHTVVHHGSRLTYSQGFVCVSSDEVGKTGAASRLSKTAPRLLPGASGRYDAMLDARSSDVHARTLVTL